MIHLLKNRGTLHPGVNGYLYFAGVLIIAGASGRTALKLMRVPWVNKIIIIVIRTEEMEEILESHNIELQICV